MKKLALFIFILPIYHLANSQKKNFDYKVNDTIIIVDQNSKDTILNKEDAERVFIDVQIKPEFPGGISGWIKYLERNINRDLPYKNGAPPGRYTVSLSFIVAKDGTISDIKAESDPGYGSKEEAIRLLQMLGLAERMDNKPNQLSGGEQQRVAVARALINQPDIVFADEPTGNLDTKTSYEIMEIFNTIHQNGNTIVLVTHEEDIANHAHRIVRLRDGVVETDRKNEKAGQYSHQ